MKAVSRAAMRADWEQMSENSTVWLNIPGITWAMPSLYMAS